jgi:hypothetical protein
MIRASKQAKRSGDNLISSTKAVAALPKNGAPQAPTLCPLLGVQNTPSRLVQPGSQFRKDKSLDHQQTHGDSLEYTRSVLAGAESLGIEMTPRLQRELGYRRGQTYSLGPFSDRTFALVNGSNDQAAGCDMEGCVVAQGHHEAVYDFEFKDNDWGSDYAGIGHQFAYLSAAESKS